MKSYFQDLVTIISKNIHTHENFTAWLSAETMDFVRFNHAQIRQAGTVNQCYLELDLINNLKHASITLSLSKNLSNDKEIIISELKKLRTKLELSHDDPYLMLNTNNNSSEHISSHKLQDKNYIITSILQEAAGLDLVGSYIGGPLYRGFANSYGQLNWFEKSSFVVDTSVYSSGDKAIKQSYGDEYFNPEHIRQKMAQAREGLSLYNKKPVNIKPGTYKVYFAPAAVHELITMLNWGGFSRKALEVKDSPLMPLFTHEKRFSSKFTLSENTQEGIGPNFQQQGFIKPAFLPIISEGQLKNTLISPKTAKEYNLEHNGADDNEGASALELSAGNLETQEIFSKLDNGLYINNLWYLNFSDRNNGCLTGMTRFFCFTVKNGLPDAPFSVMRFDDSIYRIFDDNVILTKDREMIIDNSTYDERSTSCAILPGIIAENVRFTL